MTMADLLAKQEVKKLSLFRGQEVEGTVVAILDQEIILDLGTKSEGSLPKKDLSKDALEKLKTGDKLSAFVIFPENESGQVVLSSSRAVSTKNSKFGGNLSSRFRKFEEFKGTTRTLKGKTLEVNKGGVIVEVDGIRGFLPTSQVALSQAAKLDELVGKDIDVTVIEVDPSQNRLIFSQKTEIDEDVKQNLSKLKVGEDVSGEVAAILPFGVFVSLDNGVEGLVHISEIAWEKVEDPGKVLKVKDKVEAKVIGIDSNTGRVNLSIRQLSDDPFSEKAKKLQPDDVVKGKVTKVTANGVSIAMENGLEGLIPTNKMDSDTVYEEGKSLTLLVDSIDINKRRVVLAPFITSTKDLIYK